MNKSELIPQEIPIHFSLTRSYIDDMAYVWFGKIQGVYKSRNTKNRMSKIKYKMNNKQAKKLRKAAKAMSAIRQNISTSEIYNDLKQIHKNLNKNEKAKK